MKDIILRSIALLQIFLQLINPLFLASIFSFSAHAEEKPPVFSDQAKNNASGKEKTDSTQETLATMAAESGALLQSDSASDSLKNRALSASTAAAADSVEGWLNQFGTARVNVMTDEDFSFDGTEADVLVPLYDNQRNLLFTQLGARRIDDRNMINIGLGHRYFSDNWMWGANAFYDRQISDNSHQRVGLGAELGWDYLKLAANGYFRLSDWMASSRYQDYDERAANGFDIRAEGYFPTWPHLGAQVMYEKYYGDQVALFNEDERQKDPYAFNLGLNYTPFPLLTVGVNQKLGKADQQDTQFNLALTYAPGVALDKQLDPAQVAARRTLRGGRLDLVERNNNIVLEYRKKQTLSLALPEKVEGNEAAVLPLAVTVKSQHGLDYIEWQDAELVRQGGAILTTAPGQYAIRLPHYQFSGVNSYTVSAVAHDKEGNTSNSSSMVVNVTGFDIQSIRSATTSSMAALPADGKAQADIQVALTSAAGQPATGLADQLSATLTPRSGNLKAKTPATDPATSRSPVLTGFTEGAAGVYRSTFTSGTEAGTVEIQPLLMNVKLAKTSITQQSVAIIPAIQSVTASGTAVPANDRDLITVTARVLTQNGAPHAGATVFWQADNAAATLSAAQSVSDEQGLATVTVHSKQVISTTVFARLEQGEAKNSELLTFTADNATAQVKQLTLSKTQAVANSNDQVVVTAQVTDATGHPLDKSNVKWAIDQGTATLSAAESETDAQGNATVTLTATKAGQVVVSAQTGNAPAATTAPVTFVADNATVKVTAVTPGKTEAVADGNDTITYTATVTDKLGNPLADATVNWQSTPATAQLSATTSTTNAQGQAQVSVSSTVAGKVVITAQTGQSTAFYAPDVMFTADSRSAKVSAPQASKTSALANNTDSVVLTTTVTDANNNPVPNQSVEWQVSPATGSLSAAQTTTDDQGVAQVTLTSGTAGSYQVTAAIGAQQATSGSIAFTADAQSARLVSLTADSTTNIVAGKDKVTLQAKVTDATNNPLNGVTVNWRSDNSSGVFTPAQSTTDNNGVATATFSASLAADTLITAGITGSEMQQAVSIVADSSSAAPKTVVADKTSAVADGQETVTWTATVVDANQNPVNGANVDWSSNTALAFSATSTTTNSDGIATVSATATKAGNATVTAKVAQQSLSASAVSFVGDVKSAVISKVNVDKTVVLANNSDKATYTATVLDANNNPVADADVNWTTSLNTLAAATSKTNSQGLATVALKGNAMGAVTVTAGINQSTVENAEVKFINTLTDSWSINSTSSTYNSSAIYGYPTLGFVVVAPTEGPTNLVWSANGYAVVKAPMKDEQGNEVMVTFRGERVSGCTIRPMNAAVSCESGSDTTARFHYKAADNPDLPAGNYSGVIHFMGKDWHTSYAFEFILNTTLTVSN
jgi:adhesin/invasin